MRLMFHVRCRCCSSPAFKAGKYRGSRCIEIGAGITGLPSIAAAHLNSFSQASSLPALSTNGNSFIPNLNYPVILQNMAKHM